LTRRNRSRGADEAWRLCWWIFAQPGFYSSRPYFHAQFPTKHEHCLQEYFMHKVTPSSSSSSASNHTSKYKYQHPNPLLSASTPTIKKTTTQYSHSPHFNPTPHTSRISFPPPFSTVLALSSRVKLPKRQKSKSLNARERRKERLFHTTLVSLHVKSCQARHGQKKQAQKIATKTAAK